MTPPLKLPQVIPETNYDVSDENREDTSAIVKALGWNIYEDSDLKDLLLEDRWVEGQPKTVYDPSSKGKNIEELNLYAVETLLPNGSLTLDQVRHMLLVRMIAWSIESKHWERIGSKEQVCNCSIYGSVWCTPMDLTKALKILRKEVEREKKDV